MRKMALHPVSNMDMTMTTMRVTTNFHQLKSCLTKTGRESLDSKTRPARGTSQQFRLTGRGMDLLRSASVVDPSDRSLSILPTVPSVALFAPILSSRVRNPVACASRRPGSPLMADYRESGRGCVGSEETRSYCERGRGGIA